MPDKKIGLYARIRAWLSCLWKWGQDVHIIGGPLEDAVNRGVAQGYEEGYLRKSVVDDPLFMRKKYTGTILRQFSM